MIISCIPFISTVTPITAVIPIIIVLCVSAIREIIEDLKRHRSDKEFNNKKFSTITDGIETIRSSKNIVVGDLVILTKNEIIPCDCVPIYSSLPDGICKVETAALDGETSLKTVYVPKQLSKSSENSTLDFKGMLECGFPTSNFNDFKGCFKFNGENIITLDSKNLLLQGSVLRKTDKVIAVVCYTGKYTKQSLNSSKPINKNSTLDHRLNQFVLSTVFFQLILCSIMAGFASWKYKNVIQDEGYWYLHSIDPQWSTTTYSIKKFFGYFNLISYTIPISVGVTIEVCRFIQGNIMEMDDDFKIKEFDSEGTEKVVGMKTNNCSMIEEMGGVQYILSDKTGTLTENKMQFSKCSIYGEIYHNVLSGSIQTRIVDNPKLLDFLYCLSLCNSCTIEHSDSGDYNYSSFSPDEETLCDASKKNGVILKEHTQEYISLDVLGEHQQFKLICQIEFTSSRKRMSVLVERDGLYILYCKGADNVITQLLDDSSKELVKISQIHANNFASEGLRTLFIARRIFTPEEILQWKQKFDSIDPLANDIKRQQMELYEQLENHLELIGVTAIEDQLQEDVPSTISMLREAGLKIWVITGDKMETAISVGLNCRLFISGQKMIYFNHTSELEFVEHLDQELEELYSSKEIIDNSLNQNQTLGIVIHENNIDWFIKHQKKFSSLAIKAESVICCRVSPKQKADIALCVKQMTKTKCLTIGDGANDVPMLTHGDVGVGIYGKEGNQAAITADFAIRRFKHLTKLILFYGRNGKYQITTLIKFCFYKNAAFFLMDIWFATISNFTCQIIYDDWVMTCFNTFFTSLPPAAIALFDYELPWETIKLYPKSHRETFTDKQYKIKSFVEWYLYGGLQSILFFVIFYFIIAPSDVTSFDGKVNGFTFTVVTVTTYSLFSIYLTMFVYTKRVGNTIILSFLGSILLYIILYTIIMFVPGMSVRNISYWGWLFTLKQPLFYLMIIISMVITVFPQIVSIYFQRRIKPTNTQLLQEYYFNKKRKYVHVNDAQPSSIDNQTSSISITSCDQELDVFVDSTMYIRTNPTSLINEENE
ncbi:phospholipid-transporting P-type ATPase, putative [Entamoeba histolytica HM-3:IMSS]|uniref:Phospholipid-transporting ATPase n=5 Tax=Entamoeba histolytica TaxID=5759 RepID=C4M195_ENTH1|nr:phospholipid-transporting P-type ATPase, putative [Entamoeba histolytica HM-1:IMSS]EAL48301.1 phospholipid-transporting P-type ATPase, putative [Entamoeba histolytica HM-1:IMSS]EMS12162.1 phospholipid-transporting P-type ATPase, putative [Entamoeba histolytica HM-3:IMSS]ENY65758.1 phospholipid-transporting P-type ATPase, putative [Entamoeba histolytica HM-1:IMSS-A]GAT94971.1 phospholipid-transporting p-type ATPase putative [Entamoeba histolytica]|eukprot:XP_653689.1 phospholipid-transporting P-type ATPase, putative [Entamoeba histolytica HM-1:IMSS]